MYIGKHNVQKRAEACEKESPVHLPENYAGNTFRNAPDDFSPEEPPIKNESASDEAYFLPAACQSEKKTQNRLLPSFERLFSPDSLLILLAILLSGCEDGGELSLLLLLLLLF